ncbi:hypothetical protein FACS1894152_5020 [Bacilli bacterium]|nr:hypothetical protein FACS1894152_5020 [Bacilli bacterium]
MYGNVEVAKIAEVLGETVASIVYHSDYSGDDLTKIIPQAYGILQGSSLKSSLIIKSSFIKTQLENLKKLRMFQWEELSSSYKMDLKQLPSLGSKETELIQKDIQERFVGVIRRKSGNRYTDENLKKSLGAALKEIEAMQDGGIEVTQCE